jgi:hypothetical protein
MHLEQCVTKELELIMQLELLPLLCPCDATVGSHILQGFFSMVAALNFVPDNPSGSTLSSVWATL